MLNFTSDLPAIVSTAETVDLQVQAPEQDVKRPSETLTKSRPISPRPIPGGPDIMGTKPTGSLPPPNHPASATESDSDGGPSVLDRTKGKGKAPLRPSSPALSPKPLEWPTAVPSRQISPLPVHSTSLSQSKGISSDSDSSPLRPAKKPRARVSSSDDDSEEERKKHVTQLRNGAGAPKRGTRQPIKRGGKRF
jgi:hypothetical protein